MKALVVTIPFADYEAGDMITDTSEMKKALASSPQHVVPVKQSEGKPDSKPEPAKSGTPTAPSTTPSNVKPT